MLLSIVICNHNYERFLDRAIASAVNQTFANKEIIVVDDGSTDRSAEVIAGWAGKVTSVFQPNQGQLSAYNRGFREARGDAIIFLDSDDALDLEVGAGVIEAFQDPTVVKVHYKLRLVGPDDRPLGSTIPRRLDEGDLQDVLLKRGMFYASAPGSGNAYRRSALERLMPLPDSAIDSHGADFFAVLGISLLGRVRALGPAPLASYRLHAHEAHERVLFGNAGCLLEPTKSQTRYLRLQQWLTQRLGESYQLPSEFIDFSTQKQAFAQAVLDAKNYVDGFRQGSVFLAEKLLRSIWRGRSSLAEQLGLTAWAVAVLVLPRGAARPIARYVCNPASRTF